MPPVLVRLHLLSLPKVPPTPSLSSSYFSPAWLSVDGQEVPTPCEQARPRGPDTWGIGTLSEAVTLLNKATYQEHITSIRSGNERRCKPV